jgi:CDP-diacylglycerol--glycerol-3-phosphate 3-phosphatidyltransferase
VTETTPQTPITFSDRMRVMFKGTLDAMAGGLLRLGLRPNWVTLLGLLGTTGGAVLLAFGNFRWGGVLILLMGVLDALDGSMARLSGQSTSFGAFLDSVTDRYSDLFILGGLLVYYFLHPQGWAVPVIFVAAIGTVQVSYVKARAESLGMTANIGLLSRLERFLILLPCLLLNVPMVAVWILAFLTHFTALQRIWSVWKQCQKPAPVSINDQKE